MPGNPFKKPFRGGKTRARPGRPSRPSMKSTVPTPTSPNGIQGKVVRKPSPPGVKVTTRARKNVRPPRVRQGEQMGTPGKTGSRPGASYE